MYYPYSLNPFLEHRQIPKKILESNKVKMDSKAKKKSKKYRLVKK